MKLWLASNYVDQVTFELTCLCSSQCRNQRHRIKSFFLETGSNYVVLVSFFAFLRRGVVHILPWYTFFFSLLYGFWGLNFGHQCWQAPLQVILPTRALIFYVLKSLINELISVYMQVHLHLYVGMETRGPLLANSNECHQVVGTGLLLAWANPLG